MGKHRGKRIKLDFPFLFRYNNLSNRGEVMPKVSIIVPIYNVSKYLSSCLNSLVTQSLQDIEIICVEDKSTDSSRVILREYEKNYSYLIKAIYLEENGGLSHARNEGLKVANGKYIGFVDSDDLVSHTMFEDFSKTLEEYNLPILVGNCFQIRENVYLHNEVFSRQKKAIPHIEDYLQTPASFFLETPAVWDKLFLHDFIVHERFIDGIVYEDIAFTYPLLLKAKKTVQLLQYDYAYRQRKASIMANSSLKNIQILDLFKIYERCVQSHLEPKLKSMLLDRIKHEIFSKSIQINRWEMSPKEKNHILELYLKLAEYKVENFWHYENEFPKIYYSNLEDTLKEKIEGKKKILSEKEARNIEEKLIRTIKR